MVDMNDFRDSESFGPRNRIREIRTFGSVGGWFKRLAGLPDNARLESSSLLTGFGQLELGNQRRTSAEPRAPPCRARFYWQSWRVRNMASP